MDGSIRDLVVDGRRVGLASVSFAAAAYPRFILALCHGSLSIHAPKDPSGLRLVFMSGANMRLAVLEQDFDRIKYIAERFGPDPRLTPSEPESVTLARIEAQVRVTFSDRSSF